ncbi:outer membrane protein assembly factor BamB family protein, partial [Catenulispora pinisilvae]|uniref:outer membrane protein assembly factor BamB family protein n=1 Tax=Catenulispora pinisilvae TaxID=2705253 RepID=UPI0018926663
GVVVVGGGAALAVGLGGSSGTTSTRDSEPALGGAPSTAAISPTSAAGAAVPPTPAQRSLPPGGALPPPTGALGKLQGPSAKSFWTQDTTGRVTSLAAAEGMLVVATDSDVTGFDYGGSAKWGPLPAGGIAGSGNGVVDSGVVYLVASFAGGAPGQVAVLALDLMTGSPRWTTPLPPDPSPLTGVRVAGVLGGKVFVVGTAGSTPAMWALDVASGSSVWNKAGVQYATLTVPAGGEQVLAAGSPDPNTPVTAAALDVDTGDQAWAHQLGTSVDYSHVSLSKAVSAGDRYVLLSSTPDGDVLAAGNTATGQDAWTSKLPEPAGDAGTVSLITRSPDSSAVIALSRRGVYAVEAQTGKVLWQSQGTESFVTSADGGTPQIADGNVYVCDQKGGWWAVDLATGRTRWRYAATRPEVAADPVWIAVSGGVVTSAGSLLTMILAKG